MTERDFIIQETAYQKLVTWLDRLPHALLVHGPRGIGKLQLAVRFAQFLLCEGRGSAITPCGRCDGCRWIAAGNHPDLRILEPEAIARKPALEDDEAADKGGKAKRKPSIEIRIEQVRQLDEFVHMGSHRGRRRVAIIHPAEDMNVPTANALLKNLEEPPASAVFLLVAHRPARLLPTIRSRCVQVPVLAPDAVTAAQWLETQGVKDAVGWLSFAGGAPLRALEYATSDDGVRITEWRKGLGSGDSSALEVGGDRDEMELLVDFLQKHALDAALSGIGVAPKYGTPNGPQAVERSTLRQWLTCARGLGRHRALARHPLNPKLFAAELLGMLPGRTR